MTKSIVNVTSVKHVENGIYVSNCLLFTVGQVFAWIQETVFFVGCFVPNLSQQENYKKKLWNYWKLEYKSENVLNFVVNSRKKKFLSSTK